VGGDEWCRRGGGAVGGDEWCRRGGRESREKEEKSGGEEGVVWGRSLAGKERSWRRRSPTGKKSFTGKSPVHALPLLRDRLCDRGAINMTLI
jgi:hypothetical protein